MKRPNGGFYGRHFRESAPIIPRNCDNPQPLAASAIREDARAKINLALHVTGRPTDGYHELDTLAAFSPLGDVVEATPAPDLSLTVTGPFASDLGLSDDNLVIRAAGALREAFSVAEGAHLRLEKNLPVASGIGGGSADAAATLRGLARLWKLVPHSPRIAEIAARLGADVPMCLASRPLHASGIGEVLAPVASLPIAGVLLINPRVAVATPAIFKALKSRENPPLSDIPAFADARALAAWLSTTRNDLQQPAIETAPVIAEVLSALEALPGTLLARMSGSGATCFALFERRNETETAAALVSASHPDWWIRATTLG
ncbi:4-(cytidine 5'-diphospho)-2-C-methyl-D-erythritol kinase [Breoghania sp.]|uniref:4-(cytidine 5'-diphospho)-2-C-methyl-D-erythritol kinase n=1 Tax=Breoghania sp. TaxID=2065378 RepID=UPI0026074AFF|nr:4-(cytidine 5'-diphospho)-2-C-methyl-D-erythritol kinase [Breoghania sp.]